MTGEGTRLWIAAAAPVCCLLVAQLLMQAMISAYRGCRPESRPSTGEVQVQLRCQGNQPRNIAAAEGLVIRHSCPASSAKVAYVAEADEGMIGPGKARVVDCALMSPSHHFYDHQSVNTKIEDQLVKTGSEARGAPPSALRHSVLPHSIRGNNCPRLQR